MKIASSYCYSFLQVLPKVSTINFYSPLGRKWDGSYLTMALCCESCTLTAKLENWFQAFEMKLLRRLFDTSWQDKKVNQRVRQAIEEEAGWR